MPTSFTSIANGNTAEIQAATSQVIVVRRILATNGAILEVKADATDILPALQNTQANVDVHFGRNTHPPTVPAGQALNIKNTALLTVDVWVHWELV